MINKLKVEDAGRIVPPSGKILVLREKVRKHTVTRKLPVPMEGQEKEKDPMMETKDVKQREPYYIQFYKVLSVNGAEDEYKEGMIILAADTAGADFDLIPKTKMVNKFEILGKYAEN
ncbi:MAG TPA: hypothetical protein VJ907_05920 [Halanaerobiales bacterium]|nr:hypothetical protein [Halanaerobiales bacterium]